MGQFIAELPYDIPLSTVTGSSYMRNFSNSDRIREAFQMPFYQICKSQRIFQQVTKVRWYEDMKGTQANPRFGAWWFWEAFKHIISFWSYGRSGGWDFHRNLEIFLPRWTGNEAAAYRPPPTLQPSSRCLPQSTTVWFLINPQEFGCLDVGEWHSCFKKELLWRFYVWKTRGHKTLWGHLRGFSLQIRGWASHFLHLWLRWDRRHWCRPCRWCGEHEDVTRHEPISWLDIVEKFVTAKTLDKRRLCKDRVYWRRQL